MKKTICALLIILSLNACKKNADNKPAISDRKMLLVSEKDVNPLTNDTISINKYSYDSNNRLIQETSAEPGGIYTEITKYTYDSDGNITAMYLHNATSPTYTYSNVNGKPAASLLDNQLWSSFTINNNRVTAITYYGFNYVISYTDNNFDVMITNLDAGNVVKRTFTYGTKKSPFYVGGFKYFLGDYPPYSQIQGQNEVIKRVDENTGAATGTFTFSYEYNSDNYPIKSTEYKNGVITGYHVFEYKTAN